jgi:creatinine amidohydrolase/Fe(II)-dependent formamide hydrolase-like protein
MSHPSMNQPYAYEAKPRTPRGSGAEVPDRDFLLAEMTWPEAEAKLKTVDVALLPVGAVEQHGPHLPLDTDAFDADYLCREVARACTAPRPLVLPLIPYGVSYHHEDFRGTLSVSPETLARMVYEVGLSAARHGILKLVVVNGHGGNSPALHFAAQKINRDTHIFTCVDTGESSDAEIGAITETDNDVHAGEIETSTSLAVRPDLVRMNKARRSVPRFSSDYLQFTSSRSVGWYARTSKISRTGVMGDPTKASAEKGRKIWEIMIRNLVELVEDIKGLSLSQIHSSQL